MGVRKNSGKNYSEKKVGKLVEKLDEKFRRKKRWSMDPSSTKSC